MPNQHQCKICLKEALLVQILAEKQNAHIYQCQQCKSYFADPAPTKEYLKEMYANSSMNEDAGAERLDSQGELIIPNWKAEEVKTNASILNKYRGGRESLLDIGCFWGIFLSQVKSSFKVTGLEIWPPALEYLTKKNIPAIEGTLDTVDTEHAYDIITMFDVLEHVYDLDASLQKIHTLLNKDGLFLVSVPNAAGLWPAILHGIKQRLRSKTWDPLPYPFHLYYYTLKGLRQAFLRNGLQPIFYTTRSTHAATEKAHKLSWFRKMIINAFSILGASINQGDRLILLAKKSSA